MKIYLAGGFHSGWQAKVIEACPNHTYYNPADKEPSNVRWEVNKFGAWDLHHIRKSDLIFANMERTNPGGIGLATEVGYAYGIGSTVILVLEPNHETMKDRYLVFLTECAHMAFDNLEDGIEFLKAFKI